MISWKENIFKKHFINDSFQEIFFIPYKIEYKKISLKPLIVKLVKWLIDYNDDATAWINIKTSLNKEN